MRRAAIVPALVLLAGCGGGGHARTAAKTATADSSPQVSRVPVAASAPHTRRAAPVALVTAETENRIFVVSLRSGRVRRSIRMPEDPENVVSTGRIAVVVSAAARTVTVADADSRRRRTLGGFRSPHIPMVFPGGKYAYVTDDGAGTLTAIRLSDDRALSTVQVGAGAHHVSSSPDGRRTWVALGESARTIVILDSSDPAHPRVIGHLDPGFAAHDVSFSPDGSRVWVTAADAPDVAVLAANGHRLMFQVPVGPGPQHVVFAGPYAYLTSGYGSAIEQVDQRTGRILARAKTPYGSFELDAGKGYVVTSSLLGGTLAVFTPSLRLLRVVKLAPATRDVAISAG